MGWFWVDYLLGEGRLKWSYCQYHAPTQGFQASNNTYLRPCYILHPVCDKRNMINMYIIYLHVYVQYKHIYIFIHHWFSWPGVPPNDPFGNVWMSNQSPVSCDHQKRHDFRSCCDDCLKNYICVSVKFLYMKMSQTIWDAFIHAIANYFWKHSWPVGSIKRITCLSPSKGSKHQSILLLWSQLAKMCFLKTLVPPYISGVPSYLPEEPP